MRNKVLGKYPLPIMKPPRKTKISERITKADREVYNRCINGTGRFKNYKPVFDFFETEQPTKSLHRILSLRKSSIHDILKTLEAARLIKINVQHTPQRTIKTAVQDKEFIKTLKQL